MNLNWLVGFIEGEGCFGSEERITKHGKYLVPHFILEQKDALDTLKEIQKFLGFGKVHLGRSRSTDLFEVKRIDDCIRLVNLLDSKLLLKKRQEQFDEWKWICRSAKPLMRDWGGGYKRAVL